MTAICVAYAYLETRLPLNHDVAWLLDAGSRWSHGQRLYVDLIEVNPPLVFYLYWLITLGTWTKLSFIIGAMTAIWLMGLWAVRLNGKWWGVGSIIVTLAAGAADFGQREQFAIVAAIPYLFAPRAGRVERALIGLWAFGGFALKPYLILIPALATLGRMLSQRSWRPAISAQNLVLGALCVVYLGLVWRYYPEFIFQMVPLGKLVYFAYGTGFNSELPALSIIIFSLYMLRLGVKKVDLWPFSWAVIGAIFSFVIQGKFWSYHLVPAMGLTFLVALLLAERRTIWILIVLTLAILWGGWLLHSKRRHYADLIPEGAVSVLFLSPHVGSAYPAVNEHGVRHASHYPAIWTLPGAWRLVRDPTTTPEKRRQAASVLRETREIIIGDIVKYCPDPIFVDVRERKPYFKYPFDFKEFILKDARVQNYRPDRREGMYLVYRRVAPC